MKKKKKIGLTINLCKLLYVYPFIHTLSTYYGGKGIQDTFLNQKVLISFFISSGNICCGYSLEGPHQGTSNEYPQYVSCRNKKKMIQCLLLSGAMLLT